METPAQAKDRIDREYLDKVSDVVIRKFNEHVTYPGPMASIGIPVKSEDVFSDPVIGGLGFKATQDCRAILIYIIANHVPLWDSFLMKYRLLGMERIGVYMAGRKRTSTLRCMNRGCRLIHDERFRKVYTGTMLQLASDGFEVWSTPKNIRDCA